MPASITRVEIIVTIIKGTGGAYPFNKPLITIPKGIATNQPFATFIDVDAAIFVSPPLSSGEYTPVIGDVANHAVTNGNAVNNTPGKSNDPSALWDDLPMRAKMIKPMTSTIASTGRSAGV